MKKILFIILLFVSFQSMGQGRFPTVDSLKSYILKYIRNSTVESFTNLRMQNAVYGTAEFLDSAFSEFGIDSIWITSGGSDPDTLRYLRTGTIYTVGTISGGAVSWNDLLDKPSTFAPSSHTHPISDVTDLQSSLNAKVNISDTAAMLGNYPRRQELRDSLAAVEARKQATLVSGTNIKTINGVSLLGAGDITVGGSGDDSVNTFGKQVNMYAGVLKVSRTAGANTWSMLEDATHAQVGITSVTADATKVTVNYYQGTKVITMIGAQDETMSNTALTNDGTPYYNYGPYTIGARVFEGYAEFNIRRTTHASFYVGWTGSAWSVSSGTIKGSHNGTSPAWTITWSAGRLRIANNSFPSRKVPTVQMYAATTGSTNLRYVPAVSLISDVWLDIYFYDAQTGAALTDASPPSGFAVYIDYGVMNVAVNPLTEDFGNTGSTNFWIFGMMLK